MLTIVVLAGVWWVLVRRHPGWPARRTVAAIVAFGAAAIATQSGIATHDTDSLTAHVLQHVLLGMLVPVLTALAAPVTLVLQAADHPTRRVVRLALRHPVARFLGNPLVGFVAFAASLTALTFSPLLDIAADNDAVHLVVHGARLLIVFASVPFHAFVGVALLSAGTTLFDAYPSLDDQRRAAGLLWGAGELFTLAVAAVVFVDWYRSDVRAGERFDRRDRDDQSANRANAAGT